jgi:predicted transcriptional regulator
MLNNILNEITNYTKVEKEIFYFIFIKKTNTKYFYSEKLTNIFKCNKSTVQRAIKKFYDDEFLNKYQSNIKKGGYVNYYTKKNNEEIKNILCDELILKHDIIIRNILELFK